MSGRFPQADDVEAFWRNLAQGRDCITEVPADRWDHGRYFDPDRTAPGKTCCKWGGFLDGVDRFDAPFFKITPAEAELLDPQERLFLETSWNLLESSGYVGERLQRLCRSQAGVFVGTMSQQYHAFESDLVRESLVALSSPSSIANRVSYFFNFQGPSVAIDTMCSSALVAVHMACESLSKGECRIAIAGGVNTTIHPKKYIALSTGQMIGSHPDSTSFGDGDGYLPAEGVGAVLLKPLQAAIDDGDTVLAVIKASAINHGGQSNGYRVPSAAAQADLIAGNFARAGIDPRTISYVESAANGSPLGDAIELGALTAAFQRFTTDRQFCAIGAVKSNIGHAEAASGMSQLIKVILQLRHRQLVPTIKAQPLNPNIAFERTPFHLQRRLEEWRRPVVALAGGAPREVPRRATVSSFGAGGSNAHLIVEEHEPHAGTNAGPEADPHLIVFSARTAPQLGALVRRMRAFIADRPELSMADLAYTLQTAREAMDHRLALVVDGREALLGSLRTWLEGGDPEEAGARIFAGDCGQDNSDVKRLLSGKTGQTMLDLLLAERDLEKLALYWVKGVRISWQPLHQGRGARPVALPTYPFDRQRHWLAARPEPGAISSDGAEPFAPDPQRPARENMERFLVHGVARALGMPEDQVSAARSFQDYGLDSIGLIALRRGFEQAFRVSLSTRDLLAHPTPAALAECAAARHGTPDGVKKNAAALTAPLSEGPLSEGQKGLWLLHRLAPEMSAYNVPVALRFGAGFDVGRFRQACGHMLRRFPVLGAVFVQDGGELYQRVPADAPLAFEVERADGPDVFDRLRAKSKIPFDLERGPLFRVAVLTPAAGTETFVVITVHHIVFDGSSAVLLIKALLETYRALAAGAPPPMPAPRATYGDFVEWQRQFMAGERAREQLAYWTGQLAGDLPVLALPTDRPRPARPGFEGASHEAMLPPALAERVKELAAALRVNPSVIFLGALFLLLHRYTGDDDIVIGVPTLGRPDERFDAVVGCFVNMLAIRGRISGAQDTGGFLRSLQLTVADALDHGDYPFPALLKSLRINRDQARSPLFQVMFAYQNFIRPDDGPAGDLPVEILPGVNQEGSHDLALEVYPGAGGVRLKCDYNAALFAPDAVRRTLAHYVRLLEAMAAAPQAALADHALLAPDEARRILVDWNAGDAACDAGLGIVELFRRQAARTPDRTALRFEGQALSYAELDRWSGRLAAVLA
ncbi:MAG TPA: condensation domain-containing protein, partial [Azospirillum sp.]